MPATIQRRTSDRDPAASLGDRRVVFAFTGLLVAMFLGALDQTIMATALPTIASQLGGLTELSWVVTAYVLAAAASTPVWGKASDLLGRKRLMAAAIVVFICFSALSGTAPTIGWLIAFRALQGIGGGGVMTLATASVADLIPPRERGRYQGYIQVTFLLASLVGPLVGGLFVDQLSWRWVFYVNVPVGAVALILLAGYLPTGARRHGARIDYAGAVLVSCLVVAIMLIANWAGSRYAWDSPEILGLIAATLLLAGWFVLTESSASEPVLPLRLFGDRVFRVVSASAFVATLSLFAAIVFLPVFLQLVTGASATDSGLLMLPLLGASALSTIVIGRIMVRTGRYRIFPVIGLATMSVGLLLLSTLGATGSRVAAAAWMVVFGAGFGMVTQILMVAIQNAVSPREIGTATAGVNLFRALGGSIGVALYGALFASGIRHWLPLELKGRLPQGITPSGIQSTPGHIHAFPHAVQRGIAVAVGRSLHEVFLVAGAIALAGFLVAWRLPEQPLRGGSQDRTAPGRGRGTRADVE